MEEALGGNALAMHDLGRMLVDGTGVDADAEQSHAWYAKALSAFQTVERQRPNRYVEYRIGWMLLHGVGTERDKTSHDAGRTEVHPQGPVCSDEDGDAPHADTAQTLPGLGHLLR